MKSIVTVIAVLLLWATALQAATISLAPPDSMVSLGSTFSVDIIGQNFPVTEGGGVNLFFDGDILNAISVSIDQTVWDFVNDTGTIDNGVGSISDILVSSFAGVGPGGFVVATVDFQTVGLGFAALTLTESQINPWFSGGNLIDPLFEASSANVVPEASSILFMGTGLGGLLCLMRKRTRSVTV